MTYALLCLAVAALLFLLVAGTWRARSAWAWGLLVAVFAAANLFIFSSHTFLHTSVVYRLFVGGMPPENPMLAGEALSYPWLHHYLVALLARFASLTAIEGFALLNVAALIGLAWAVHRTAGLLELDRVGRALAVVLALCGASPLMRGPLKDLLVQVPGLRIDERVYPVIKLVSLNNNGVGLCCAALALYGLARLLSDAARPRADLALVVGALLGAGLLYPLLLAATCGSLGLCCLVAIVRHPEARARAAWGLGALVLASLLALPWFLLLRSGRQDQDAFFRLGLSLEQLLRNGGILLLANGPLLLWLALQPEPFRRILGAKPRVSATLLGVTGSAQLAFLLLVQPGHSEYKYLALSFLPLGCVLAGPLAELRARRPWLVAGLLTLQLLPLSSYLVLRGAESAHQADPLQRSGPWLEPRQPEEAQLFRWIRAETPPDTLFVDTHLTIPPLTGRSLLIGLDLRRAAGRVRGKRDGWAFSIGSWLETNMSTAPELVAARRELALSLLIADPGLSAAEVRAQLPAPLARRPLYVIARGAERCAALAACPALRRVRAWGDHLAAFSLAE